jgi:hypothetical protein
VIGSGKIPLILRALLAGARAVSALALAVSLVVAPAHFVSHHLDSGEHACAVCTLAKCPVEMPAMMGAVISVDRIVMIDRIPTVLEPVAIPAALLPPERAPPSCPALS